MTRNKSTDFFAAVAAAIPALFVAYAVGLTGYATKELGPDYERDAKITVAAFLDVVSKTTGRLQGAALVFVALVRSDKERLVSRPLFPSCFGTCSR